jgi:hypothetical protein
MSASERTGNMENEMENEKDYLTIEEAMAVTGKSKRTMQRWIQKGIVTAIKALDKDNIWLIEKASLPIAGENPFETLKRGQEELMKLSEDIKEMLEEDRRHWLWRRKRK